MRESFTHVRTNCFILIKAAWEESGEMEWEIYGVTNTVRFLSNEDEKGLN